MTVFLDTSAVLAVVDADDKFHARGRQRWAHLLDEGATVLTSNYVLLESIALLQRRLGIEAVSVLLQEIQPTLEIVWIDRELHSGAAATLIAANRRQLSLVDLTSFAIMHQRGIDAVFTFDEHFAEQGFTVV